MLLEQYLYRYFDCNGVLLYVGRSNDFILRLKQHRRSSEWFNKITQINIEKFPDLKSVKSAEVKAIETEYPAHNKIHSKSFKYKSIKKVITMKYKTDRHLTHVIKNLKSEGKSDLDISEFIDGLVLNFINTNHIVWDLKYPRFHNLHPMDIANVKVPINISLRRKLFNLRNDIPANELISDLLLSYQYSKINQTSFQPEYLSTGYKIPTDYHNM